MPFLAQAQDSATVDVTATIVQAQVPISVTGQQALQFGAVQLPADPALGGCGYSIGPIGNTALRGIDGPRENCAFVDSNQAAGQFGLGCAPDSDITLSVSFESTITQTDGQIQFSTSDFDVLLDGASPYDGPSRCDADGQSLVTIGGDLAIGAAASALPADTVIGTITLDASY